MKIIICLFLIIFTVGNCDTFNYKDHKDNNVCPITNLQDGLIEYIKGFVENHYLMKHDFLAIQLT